MVHITILWLLLAKHFTEVHGAEELTDIVIVVGFWKHFTEVHGAEAKDINVWVDSPMKHFTEVHGAEGWLTLT